MDFAKSVDGVWLRVGVDPGGGAVGAFRYVPVVDGLPDFAHETPEITYADTTGAGDCFVGALAARLAAGATLVEAARYANVAAACSVERLGAAPSMPTSREVAARLARA